MNVLIVFVVGLIAGGMCTAWALLLLALVQLPKPAARPEGTDK